MFVRDVGSSFLERGVSISKGFGVGESIGVFYVGFVRFLVCGFF